MINIWKKLLTILQAEEPEGKKEVKRSFKWVKLLIVLSIIALIIIGGYVFLFKIKVGASFRYGIGSWFSTGWSRLWQTIKGVERQARGLGEWSAPYISPEEKKEKKGIEITNLEFPKPFLAGQDMFIFAEGKVHALSKPSTVEFECFKDKKPGIIDKQTLYVEKIDTPFGVRCDFGQAPEVEGVKYSKVKFSAVYNDFETATRLKLYTLSESKLEELKGINPFDYYEVPSEPTLDRNKRTTKADCGYGETVCEPLMIDLRVIALQPLSDDKYTLIVTVRNKPLWGGSLVKDRPGTLMLEFFGNINPLGETVFELDKDEQTHYCDFSIQGAEDDISSVEIRAKAVYDYGFVREDTITLASKEAMAV